MVSRSPTSLGNGTRAEGSGSLGGEGATVEADETYLGKAPKTRKPEGTPLHAHPAIGVLSLVERGGQIRSWPLAEKAVRDHLAVELDERSRLVTDESTVYKTVMPFAHQRESVDHTKFEWTRGDVQTNTLERFFWIFKRGLVGVYHHIDKKHLDRYLAEFDFRQNTRAKLKIIDSERMAIAVAGAKGNRLTYRQADCDWKI